MKDNDSCLVCDFSGECYPNNYRVTSGNYVEFRADKGIEFNSGAWCNRFIKHKDGKEKMKVNSGCANCKHKDGKQDMDYVPECLDCDNFDRDILDFKVETVRNIEEK